MMRRCRDVGRVAVDLVQQLHPSFKLIACLLIVAFTLPGCDQKPAFIFVLETSQVVELEASASARQVSPGESFVLNAQRKTSGNWRRIASHELMPGQCWMAALPPEREKEVADNLHWVVEPQGAATFNIDFRPDHTRAVSISKEGVFTFTPSTAVWCEPGRSVSAPPIRIEVTPR